MTKARWYFTAFVAALLAFLLWGGVRLYRAYRYELMCGRHIKAAANATTIEEAQRELEVAILWAEKEGLKEGSTGILSNTDNNVGAWFQRLAAARWQLNDAERRKDSAGRAQTLSQVQREINEAEERRPRGISIFPNNTLFAGWGLGSSLVALFTFCACFVEAVREALAILEEEPYN